MFIAEVAMLDRDRPNRMVLRATKMLSATDWFGVEYTERYPSDDALVGWLNAVPVGVVVLEDVPPELIRPHHERLRRVLEASPDEWELAASYPAGPSAAAAGERRIRVFSNLHHRGGPQVPIRIEVKRLGRVLEY